MQVESMAATGAHQNLQNPIASGIGMHDFGTVLIDAGGANARACPGSTEELPSNPEQIPSSPPSGQAQASNSTLPSTVPLQDGNPNHEGLLVAPTNTCEAFVNVFMIVDPESRTCVVPKQVISYKQANNVVSTAVFGPKVLTTPPGGDLSAALSGATLVPQPQTAESKPESGAAMPKLPNVDQGQQALVPALLNSCSPLLSNYLNSQAEQAKEQQEDRVDAPSTTTVRNTDNRDDNAASLPPLRALSAYNFFFRDERERVLHGTEPDWSESKKCKLLEEHWYQDRNKKRRHRKTHGKIDFTTLSKLISTRWKELPQERKDFYRQIASRDFERFKRESAQAAASRHEKSLSDDASLLLPEDPAFQSHAAVVG